MGQEPRRGLSRLLHFRICHEVTVKMSGGATSSEGLTRAGVLRTPSHTWQVSAGCWLENSVPFQVNLPTGLLQYPSIMVPAPLRPRNPKKTEQGGGRPHVFNDLQVSHCHFCFIPFVRKVSLSPAHIQEEGN